MTATPIEANASDVRNQARNVLSVYSHHPTKGELLASSPKYNPAIDKQEPAPLQEITYPEQDDL